jgi:hypothetical protein
MGLPARQRRVLYRIEGTLRGSDPRLAALYAIFSRLTRDEEMPRIEQVRYGIRRVVARIGHISASIRTRRHIRLMPRQPVVLFFPLVLALAVVSIVLIARSGPGCTPVRPVARAHTVVKASPCRPATSFNPMFGR